MNARVHIVMTHHADPPVVTIPQPPFLITPADRDPAWLGAVFIAPCEASS